jgi:hypothetical protein
MALYPIDSVVSDSYSVVQPPGADSLRPAAAVGLRLFSQTTVKGYQGDSGAVVLVRSRSGQVSGRLSARARSVQNGDPIRLRGKFERVAIVPQKRGCTPMATDSSADTVTGTIERAERVDGQVD